MKDIHYIDEDHIEHKRVLIRVDYNVSLNKDHSIGNDERIRQSIPTLEFLLKHHNKLVLLAHLGSPKGPEPDLSLKRGAHDLQKFLPDHEVKLIKTVGEHARSVYSLSGIVQHGASTLPKEKFSEFPAAHTIEIHLSTGIQNIVFDSLPESVRNSIYSWLTLNCDKDRKAEWTDEQFFYRTRKKAIAAFKEQLWELSPEEKQPILANISSYLEELFLSLGMKDTKDTVEKYYK